MIFGDKTVRVLGFHIWNQLLETLIANSSFQTLERSLNDWFKPKWMFSLEVNKNYIRFFYDNIFPVILYVQMKLMARNPLSIHLKEERLTARRKIICLPEK